MSAPLRDGLVIGERIRLGQARRVGVRGSSADGEFDPEVGTLSRWAVHTDLPAVTLNDAVAEGLSLATTASDSVSDDSSRER